MTTLVVGLVLVVAGVAFAAAPFLRRRPGEVEAVEPLHPSAGAGPPSATAASVAPPRDAAGVPVTDAAALPLAAELEELELDRAMGKLANADYERLRTELLRRVGAMASSVASEPAVSPAAPRSIALATPVAPNPAPASPGVASSPDPPPADEASPVAGGGGAAVALAEAAERLVREARDAQGAGRHCATCGPRPEPGARFCSRCGMALGGCPACGATVRADGARFCDQCGTPLIA